MGRSKTRLLKGSVKRRIDPTYYLTDQGTGYTSLWLLSEETPAAADDTSIVVFPKNETGYMKVIPGTENETILAELPTTFDQYGWRTSDRLNGDFEAGDWSINLTIVTTKYVTGNISVHMRLWKSTNPDGSGATPITDWILLTTIDSPTANTEYSISTTITLSTITLSDEYLFVEFALGTTSACGSATGCDVIFRCNSGSEYIVTTTFTPVVPAVVEHRTVAEFPMVYYTKTPCELRSKVEGATIVRVVLLFPPETIKKGRALELKDKWS